MPEEGSRAPRRPAGRVGDTHSGADEVNVIPDTPDEPGRRARRAAAARPADDVPTQADATPDALDERERRQSSKRKAPGKKRGRLSADDVVIESTPAPADTSPTEPT